MGTEVKRNKRYSFDCIYLSKGDIDHAELVKMVSKINIKSIAEELDITPQQIRHYLLPDKVHCTKIPEIFINKVNEDYKEYEASIRRVNK